MKNKPRDEWKAHCEMQAMSAQFDAAYSFEMVLDERDHLEYLDGKPKSHNARRKTLKALIDHQNKAAKAAKVARGYLFNLIGDTDV